MKRLFLFILTGCFLLTISCKQKGYPKPSRLLKPDEMVNILYDIHLGQATTNHLVRHNSDSIALKSNEIYQGILDKYNLEDSVLAKNIIYYSSRPKEYEKIYSKVIDQLKTRQEEIEEQVKEKNKSKKNQSDKKHHQSEKMKKAKEELID